MLSDEICIAELHGGSSMMLKAIRRRTTRIALSEDSTTEDEDRCVVGFTDDLIIQRQNLVVNCKSFSSFRSGNNRTTTGHLTQAVTTTMRRSSLDRTRARRPFTLLHDLAQIRLKQRPIGSGGFGSVHVGTLNNGRMVAVKQMHRCVKNRRAVAESVRAECLALRLNHPNVVRVLAVIAGEHHLAAAAADEEAAMVVMEYAGQRNLQGVINDCAEELGFQRILRYCIDIASAINYIHRNRIVHLDLKPSNIVITPQDTCKLVDFGCCRSLDEIHSDPQSPKRRSELTGTFAYRAPELLRGLAPTSKADIYSFGIVLWQLLTRDVPYAMESQHAVIFRVVAQGLRPQVPDWIDDDDCGASSSLRCYRDLFVACWSSAPEHRPSASGVHAALSAIRCTSQ